MRIKTIALTLLFLFALAPFFLVGVSAKTPNCSIKQVQEKDQYGTFQVEQNPIHTNYIEFWWWTNSNPNWALNFYLFNSAHKLISEQKIPANNQYDGLWEVAFRISYSNVLYFGQVKIVSLAYTDKPLSFKMICS